MQDGERPAGAGLLIEGVVIYPGLAGLPRGAAEPGAAGASAGEPIPDGAVWISGGLIRAVGPLEAVAAAAGADTPRLDGQGAVALPGLWDSHIHLGSWALARRRVDLGGCRSLDEVIETLSPHAEALPAGEWLEGQGLALNALAEGPGVDGRFLDALAHRPVLLWSHDMHTVLMNRAAMVAAGVGTGFESWPPGSVVGRDPRTGELTGVFREKAIEVVMQSVPQPSLRDLAGRIESAQVELFRRGLVGVHSPEGPDVLGALGVLREQGRLRVKVRLLPPASMLETLRSAGIRQGFGDEYLKLGPVKAFADGSLGSLTAALLSPYSGLPDPAYAGELLMDGPAVEDLALRAAEAGFAIAVHAIGDRACRAVLDGVQAARRRGMAPLPFPSRIEHVQLVAREDVQRLAALGVVPSMQPIHAPGDRPAAERYWQGRTAGAYAFRWILEAGAVLAFGSDAPVESVDPLEGIYAAVVRSSPGGRDGTASPWHPEHALAMVEAVRAYTLGASLAVGEGGQRGLLKPGLAGDVVLLKPDILSADRGAGGQTAALGEGYREQAAALLSQARVLATVVDGHVVYTA